MNDFSTLVFRRKIRIAHSKSRINGVVRVALEDDFHHFRVQVNYSNGIVVAVRGEAIRTPYTLCRDATAMLTQLEGMPLSADPAAASLYGDQRQQCTHMLDEAALGISTAARGIDERVYDIAVPRHVNGVTTPRLWRDGKKLLEWSVDNATILGPEPFSALPLGKGMSHWIQKNLDFEMAEAAFVLRRCAMISLGRLRNLDLHEHARPSGLCYAQQPQRAELAKRVIQSTLDFTYNSQDLIATDQRWLENLPE